MRRILFAVTTFAAFTAAVRTPAAAQDQPPGISLRGGYTAAERAAVAVRPFAGIGATAVLLDSMSTIVERDLTMSDRFDMIATPASLATGPVNYSAWNGLRAWYLVTGDVTATAAGYELELTLHDVVYSKVKSLTRYRIPAPTAPDFRLALHAISDEIVRTITNQPGAAATRIAFERQNRPTVANDKGTYDLLIVDADGFGMRRLSGAVGQIYSPAWSPDGTRLVYMQGADAGQRIVERDIQTGATRVISSAPLSITPVYSPDGKQIAYSAWYGESRGANSELFVYDAVRNCCAKRITSSPLEDQSPTYSPDGSQIAFMSSRLGSMPHIWVMPSAGGAATLITPYVVGQNGYYFAPDWSPTSSEIVFAGHWNSRGNYQIMIADAKRAQGQIRQLTSQGDNEDPSWAPDGRHIVFSSGVGDQQLSLYVIDAVTETRRRLVAGGKLRMSDWSPPLARASDYVVR
jgi:TolB protein